ncbi:MAG: cobalt-zinc-cadmium efflux system outer membrane protein [Verrucomicrobiales bacterium]|jgi:cobalt-zinc-cadmium efflux system outer membrane protein
MLAIHIPRPVSAWALMVICVVGSLRADEPALSHDSTLPDYIAFGIAHNPGLKAAHQRHQAALEKILQARALPDPKLMATHFVEDIQTRTGPQENQVFVSQMFPWFGKLRLRGAVASKEAEAIEHAYEAEVLMLARDIGLTYYDYAYLGEATEITREVLELLERLEESVREKVRAGGDLAPLLRLEVEIAKTRDAVQGLEKQRGSQSADLNALLGRREAGVLPWPKSPAPDKRIQSRSGLVQQLLAENPELKMLQSRIEKAEEAVALAKKSPIPDPTFGVGVFDTGEALNPATTGSGDDPWAIQISFSIPLGMKKYRAERREAEANYEAAKQTLTDHENALLAKLERALRDLAEVEERIALYDETLLPKARQSLEVTESSYSADRSTILDLIDSERTLLEIERTYQRAIADHYKSHVRLQTLTGQQPK